MILSFINFLDVFAFIYQLAIPSPPPNPYKSRSMKRKAAPCPRSRIARKKIQYIDLRLILL